MRAFWLLAVLLAFVAPAGAKSWAERGDVEIVALDLATGALKWTRGGTAMGNAHFELYPGLLIAYPHYDEQNLSSPLFLDPATGKPTADSRKLGGKPTAKSWTQWARPRIVLDNGWEVTGFRAGYTKDIEVSAGGKVVWTIKSPEYPEQVRGYRDLVLHAYGYLTNKAIIHAHSAKTKAPAWTLDFNQHLKTTKATSQGRVAMQVVDGVLYAQVGQYVFAIEPATGKVIWQLDAARATGLAYQPELYGGALDIAVFARDRDVVVVAFEKRVLALRAATGALIWHVAPDTFPHSAFPIARDGVVYLTSGPKRGQAIAAPRTAARP